MSREQVGIEGLLYEEKVVYRKGFRSMLKDELGRDITIEIKLDYTVCSEGMLV